jgi:hypothetical protein
MKKNCLLLLFLLVFLLFPVTSCKKKEIKPVIDTTIYEIGKSVAVTNKSEITVQDILPSVEFKLQATTDGIQSFPFVYLKKDKSGPRIIRIEKDGTTVDTLIDTVSSKTYSSAYIVEAGGDLNKTIARYVLDTKKNIIKPKSATDQFIFISILYKNNTKKPVLTKDFTVFLELPNKTQIQVDTILAETILSSSIPKEIKPGEMVSLRYVGVISKESKDILVSFEGKYFKWENKEIKATK